MLLIARIAVAAAYLVSLVYSTVFLKKTLRPSYFKCSFYGLLPLCLSGFYRLVLETMPSLQGDFSLGILGEAAAYIFVTTANTKLIIKEKAEKKAYLSVPGLICALTGVAVLVLQTAFELNIVGLIRFAIYAITLCPCLYYCAEVCANRFDNPFKASVKPFNLLVIAHCFATAIFPLTEKLQGLAGTVIAVICIISLVVPGLIGMLLLKKGLEPWEWEL